MTFYAIRTAPQREITVEAMLRRKGYDAFCPCEVMMRRTRHKRKTLVPVSYPMLTRYVFVRFPFSFLHLMAERHVTGVVGFDGAPAPIADSEIERLRNMSADAVPYRHSVNPHRALRVGELAEIQSGAFQGQIVKVEGLHGAKAKIMMNLFGTRKLVEIATENLEAA